MLYIYIYLYMVTLTINIPPMLAYIPYKDPMGDIMGIEVFECRWPSMGIRYEKKNHSIILILNLLKTYSIVSMVPKMSKFPSDTADELSSAVPMTGFQQHAERSERD